MELARVPLDELVRVVLAGDLHNNCLAVGVLALHAALTGDGVDALRPADAPWPARPFDGVAPAGPRGPSREPRRRRRPAARRALRTRRTPTRPRRSRPAPRPDPARERVRGPCPRRDGGTAPARLGPAGPGPAAAARGGWRGRPVPGGEARPFGAGPPRARPGPGAPDRPLLSPRRAAPSPLWGGPLSRPRRGPRRSGRTRALALVRGSAPLPSLVPGRAGPVLLPRRDGGASRVCRAGPSRRAGGLLLPALAGDGVGVCARRGGPPVRGVAAGPGPGPARGSGPGPAAPVPAGPGRCPCGAGAPRTCPAVTARRRPAAPGLPRRAAAARPISAGRARLPRWVFRRGGALRRSRLRATVWTPWAWPARSGVAAGRAAGARAVGPSSLFPAGRLLATP